MPPLPSSPSKKAGCPLRQARRAAVLGLSGGSGTSGSRSTGDGVGGGGAANGSAVAANSDGGRVWAVGLAAAPAAT
eukprot:CAMPEP_0194568016 /NCGR_PEP_ID=MMETSP0292-20121207/6294_1 /TAXON_ID=39354 /ORGANISM="Heterosigma akashiwo, Strain CCMP2393" /LENGTH=75 /DNA_ID=CAMNT_0039417969 /DNA_START=1164 /DNA_END=1391 /DNA_ORIENTATION=+